MARATRSGARAIAAIAAVGAMALSTAASPATAEEGVQVLRGTQPSPSFASFPDVVVLRGARVGGPVPAPEPPAPAAPAAPAPPPATVVQIFVAPAPTQESAVIGWPYWTPRHARGHRHGKGRHSAPGFWPAPRPDPRGH